MKRLVFQRSGRVFGLGPRRGSGGLRVRKFPRVVSLAASIYKIDDDIRLGPAARLARLLMSSLFVWDGNSQRSARLVWAFAIAFAMLSFDKFWAAITRAVLAR